MQPERLSRPEFIALIAMTISTVAFSVDAMLPGLSTIAEELSPEAPNRAQLILTVFMLGMGLGTFFVGVLADAFGRRPIIFAGAVLFILSSAIAWSTDSLETVLVARFVQGLGAASPRVIGLTVVRDMYSGRTMAKIMSFALAVFALVPVLAPSIGAGLIALFGWRSIFGAFILFSVISTLWYAIRLRETLAPEHRRPLSLENIAAGIKDVFSYQRTRRAIFAQTFMFGVLFGMLATVQPIFVDVFQAEETFPYWFGFVAIIAGSGAILNGQLVERVGMRRMIMSTTSVVAVMAACFGVGMVLGLDETPFGLPAFIALMIAVFFSISVSMGNLNAIALEPLGHLAGLAASVTVASATVAGALLSFVVSATYNGSAALPAFFIALFALLTLATLATIDDD